MDSIKIEQEVYIITNCEYGWDCVLGVYISIESAINYCKSYVKLPVEEVITDINDDKLYPCVIHKKLLKK